jgi:hypothetical protein
MPTENQTPTPGTKIQKPEPDTTNRNPKRTPKNRDPTPTPKTDTQKSRPETQRQKPKPKIRIRPIQNSTSAEIRKNARPKTRTEPDPEKNPSATRQKNGNTNHTNEPTGKRNPRVCCRPAPPDNTSSKHRPAPNKKCANPKAQQTPKVQRTQKHGQRTIRQTNWSAKSARDSNLQIQRSKAFVICCAAPNDPSPDSRLGDPPHSKSPQITSTTLTPPLHKNVCHCFACRQNAARPPKRIAHLLLVRVGELQKKLPTQSMRLRNPSNCPMPQPSPADMLNIRSDFRLGLESI